LLSYKRIQIGGPGSYNVSVILNQYPRRLTLDWFFQPCTYLWLIPTISYPRY